METVDRSHVISSASEWRCQNGSRWLSHAKEPNATG